MKYRVVKIIEYATRPECRETIAICNDKKNAHEYMDYLWQEVIEFGKEKRLKNPNFKSPINYTIERIMEDEDIIDILNKKKQ